MIREILKKKYPTKADCMVEHFMSNSIVDRFYSEELLKDKAKLEIEIKPYIGNADTSCDMPDKPETPTKAPPPKDYDSLRTFFQMKFSGDQKKIDCVESYFKNNTLVDRFNLVLLNEKPKFEAEISPYVEKAEKECPSSEEGLATWIIGVSIVAVVAFFVIAVAIGRHILIKAKGQPVPSSDRA